MASQLEQLLTCCICLDRFRNPKLLPCQHSVCMEPCMEGLVDYVRRQVKCPECRAEHRIPYNGVQGLPSNVTLQRFLDAHIEITGETPDPHTGQLMERCNVCNEKNYVTVCSHCEKKICDDCKSAHTDILKREIGRINNQVKRSVHRLGDQLSIVERNITALKQNSDSVKEEMENISKRLQKAVKDRIESLKSEVINYYNTEHRHLILMKEGLEQEVSNVDSNSDLADKHMDSQTQWDDHELMDAKDIFLKTVEFIRSFDYDSGDYNRRVRFNVPDDINKLANTLTTLGDLVIHNPKQTIEGFNSGTSLQSGLMKSKSDHRLAAQFRDQDDSHGLGRTSPIPRRRFGERPHVVEEPTFESPNDIGSRRKFRSRFMRRGDEDEERSVRFGDDDHGQQKQRTKVIDTEDVARGPLSGITRMIDSPRVLQRLQDKEGKFKKKKEEPPKPATPPVAKAPVSFGTPRKTARQTSEDEIDKIKKQNKGESGATGNSTTPTPKPSFERLASIKDNERTSRVDRTSSSPRSGTLSPASSVTHDEEPSRRTSRDHTGSRFDYSSTNSTTPLRKTSTADNSSALEANKAAGSKASERLASRSDSTDSNKSAEGVNKTSSSTTPSYKRTTSTEAKTSVSSPRGTNTTSSTGSSRFQSRYLPKTSTLSTEASKEDEEDDEEETSEESETEDSEVSSEEDDEDGKPKSTTRTRGTTGTDSGYSSNTGRWGNTSSSKDNSHRKTSHLDTSKTPKENSDDIESKYPYASKFLNRSKTSGNTQEDDSKSSFTSRYLNRSKSSAILGPDKNKTEESYSTPGGSSRAKFDELKERRQRLARSKSSAGMDDEETTPSNDTSYRSRYGRDSDSSSKTINARGGSGSSNAGSTEDAPTNQLSNWARYLKNKYGNKSGSGSASNSGNTSTSNATGASSTQSSRNLARSRSSHLLGMAKEDSVEDESKNVHATPTSPPAGILGHTPFGNIHRSQYLQKQKPQFIIGSRGSEPGNFTWPRGISVGPDDIIVVADSSNHRVQVFDTDGKFQKDFGAYGNGEGEFDCLAGVTVNRIGQFIIADRYNHRIQIFDPSGMFLRSFGSQGSSDGKFSYPWGVTTDALGFIYICDKENHRIQVFQSDGTFVGKFGSLGSKTGQLEHPHYIAVSSTNRVIVSDSNNHRIQIFDINGKVQTAFGSEGSEDGQFKFPRGVAVDEQGYIFVADSGNNRIQIFHPDGAFLRAFGCWGFGDGEFKGLEGVAVMSNGRILICDRENHRVQAF